MNTQPKTGRLRWFGCRVKRGEDDGEEELSEEEEFEDVMDTTGVQQS